MPSKKERKPRALETRKRDGSGMTTVTRVFIARNASGIAPAVGKSLLIYEMTVADKTKIIRAGVPKKDLLNIKTALGLDYDELSEVLSVSRTTLINKKPAQKFDKPTSERIVMLGDVMNFGYEVFGEKGTFNSWLKTPSDALGNVTPLSVMDTLYGIDEVKKEIGRIAYGVY